MDQPEITEQQAREHDFQKGESDEVTTIFSESLGSVPTRVIIVEELMACKVIGKNKGQKRIAKILEEAAVEEFIEQGMHDGRLTR